MFPYKMTLITEHLFRPFLSPRSPNFSFWLNEIITRKTISKTGFIPITTTATRRASHPSCVGQLSAIEQYTTMAPSTATNKPPASALVTTESTVVQKQTERECQPYLGDLTQLPDDQQAHCERIGLFKENRDNNNDGNDWVQLLRDKHRRYLEGVWKRPLKAPFVSLDSSRPWMLYWCLHGYDLLAKDNDNTEEWITDAEGSNMVATLEDCWEAYHTPHSQIPEIVESDDAIYFQSYEDDEGGEGAEKLYYCGGFGGGPGQMAHAATTYAAVLALCILATSDAGNDDKTEEEYYNLHYSQRARIMLSEIRIPLYRWMASLQVPTTGGYRMQHDGEVDVRATYTIACCSKLLGLLEKPNTAEANSAPNFTVLGRPKVINFVKSCQTYEGGMGGEPFSEAHGGYTFCAVAALKLLGALTNSNHNGVSFDVGALLGWLGRRQLSYEGGFSGRSNKLVDGCYSFWQGGAVAIASSCAESLASVDGSGESEEDPWLARYHLQHETMNDTSTAGSDSLPFPLLYDVFLLERYILLCAQEVTGGLRDKPSKPRDFYHTCYNLSGLSVAQHCSFSGDESEVSFGDPQQTQVGQTHPCYNIRTDRVAKILAIDWQNE